jgi:hypothetical protein
MSQDWRALFGTIDVSTSGVRGNALKPVTTPAHVAHAPQPPATTAAASTQQPAVQYPGYWTMAQTVTASAAQFVASGGKTVSREIREERLSICKLCPQYDGTRCIQCGCFIAAKTWMAHEKCPAAKWPEVQG